MEEIVIALYISKKHILPKYPSMKKARLCKIWFCRYTMGVITQAEIGQTRAEQTNKQINTQEHIR